MTVLLAGGAGYIGSHTAVQLLMSGHDVVIADDYSNSCPEVINRIEEIVTSYLDFKLSTTIFFGIFRNRFRRAITGCCKA